MIRKRYKSIIAVTCLTCLMFSNNVYAANYSFSFTGTASGNQYSTLTQKRNAEFAYSVKTSRGSVLSSKKYITVKMVNSSNKVYSYAVKLNSANKTFNGTYKSTLVANGMKVKLQGTASAVGCASSGTFTP